VPLFHLAPDIGGGGRMVLNERALRDALLEDQYRHSPVTVLSVFGPRGTRKSALMDGVLRATLGSDATSASGGFERTQAPEVGIVMWSQLLPVTLPDGQKAGLLLVDTVGVLDEPGGSANAAVLTMSALVSSVLVITVNSEDNGSNLAGLRQLSGLKGAAADVENCTLLQEVVLLMRGWCGTNSTGPQTGLDVLDDWARKWDVNDQARMSITEVWELYGQKTLFLDRNTKTRKTLPHPVAMLVQKSQRKVKRFGKESLSAEELFNHFKDFASILSQNAPKPEELVGVIVEKNNNKAIQNAVDACEATLGDTTTPDGIE